MTVIVSSRIIDLIMQRKAAHRGAMPVRPWGSSWHCGDILGGYERTGGDRRRAGDSEGVQCVYSGKEFQLAN